ncbi:MAG: N-acetylglucosamine kinase [Candidatus Kapaibacteriales bacterium]
MSDKFEFTIIGIDGGGTRTRAILTRGTEILSQTSAGTTRVGSIGVGESSERLLTIIVDLCEQAQIETSEVDIIVVGLAGVWLEEEKQRSTHLLKTLARTQNISINDLIITSDAEIAVEGAFKGGNGIVLIVGTGSIAIGKIGKGKFIRCGGWGIELDDEGSGAWIGREGLTAVVRALDGRGKATQLTEKLADFNPLIDINNPRTIVRAYAEKTFEYQMLTPTVMRCAELGDEVCLDIIQRSTIHLLELLNALYPAFNQKNVPVALLGGIVESKSLLGRMLEELIDKDSRFRRIVPKGTPLDGAILIGKRILSSFEE